MNFYHNSSLQCYLTNTLFCMNLLINITLFCMNLLTLLFSAWISCHYSFESLTMTFFCMNLMPLLYFEWTSYYYSFVHESLFIIIIKTSRKSPSKISTIVYKLLSQPRKHPRQGKLNKTLLREATNGWLHALRELPALIFMNWEHFKQIYV